VALKVISGDDPLTVSAVAEKAGIEGARNFIDMSAFSDMEDLPKTAERYTVFGRVSPVQKRELVKALKENGRTVCMTGDGVNDVLAMKEANCSVAMINGSDAARGASDFVLMSSDFSAMIKVLREGRRIINNIENVAALYLVKTIYSALLSLIYSILPYPYPFNPIHMTPINFFVVGVPSFLLALRGNYERPTGRFIPNVLESSVPAALTVVFNILVIQCAGIAFELEPSQLSTMNVFLTSVVGIALLTKVGRPLTKFVISMICVLGMALALVFLFFGSFFSFDTIISRNVFFYGPLTYTSIQMFSGLRVVIKKIEKKFFEREEKREKSKKYKIVV
jgi:cation-transporting ATPase E